jgi:hypothetical protein
MCQVPGAPWQQRVGGGSPHCAQPSRAARVSSACAAMTPGRVLVRFGQWPPPKAARLQNAWARPAESCRGMPRGGGSAWAWCGQAGCRGSGRLLLERRLGERGRGVSSTPHGAANRIGRPLDGCARNCASEHRHLKCVGAFPGGTPTRLCPRRPRWGLFIETPPSPTMPRHDSGKAVDAFQAVPATLTAARPSDSPAASAESGRSMPISRTPAPGDCRGPGRGCGAWGPSWPRQRR